LCGRVSRRSARVRRKKNVGLVADWAPAGAARSVRGREHEVGGSGG
jgi:hypothetical protein